MNNEDYEKSYFNPLTIEMIDAVADEIIESALAIRTSSPVGMIRPQYSDYLFQPDALDVMGPASNNSSFDEFEPTGNATAHSNEKSSSVNCLGGFNPYEEYARSEDLHSDGHGETNQTAVDAQATTPASDDFPATVPAPADSSAVVPAFANVTAMTLESSSGPATMPGSAFIRPKRLMQRVTRDQCQVRVVIPFVPIVQTTERQEGAQGQSTPRIASPKNSVNVRRDALLEQPVQRLAVASKPLPTNGSILTSRRTSVNFRSGRESSVGPQAQSQSSRLEQGQLPYPTPSSSETSVPDADSTTFDATLAAALTNDVYC